MNCTVRVGQGRLEYNPLRLEGLSLFEVEQLMRIEMIRLFLKHPYERQPDGVKTISLALGSDVTIADNYNKDSHNEQLPLKSPKDYKLKNGESFEWYVRKIDDMLADESSDDDRANLWQEDGFRMQEINDIIKNLNQWGSIPGNIVDMIEASTKARIDYRQIIQGFRGSILSSKKKLTRMKPNRRNGFDQMGSAREFTTRLLVAVDVSGSIDDSNLSNFYSVINKLFKYGIDQIDCVQFDVLMGPIKNIRKASRKVEVVGRGGTSFQPIFDYLVENDYYDGLIILTDGIAPHPKIDSQLRTQVLWVCDSEQTYNTCHQWMELMGRCCWMII